MFRQRRLIAVAATFMIGCAVLASQSHGAAAEEGRCDETRTIVRQGGAGYATNDVPGCPNGGLLAGNDRADYLYGGEGEDEVRGLGSPDSQADELWGGNDSDVLYGGADMDFLYGQQDDDVLYGGDGGDILLDGGKGEDVIHGGDGNDYLVESADGLRDKLYCGKGRDHYSAETIDYVDSTCEEGALVDTGGPPLIFLAGATLLLSSGLMLSRYATRRVS